jgi:hypothetical protein
MTQMLNPPPPPDNVDELVRFYRDAMERLTLRLQAAVSAEKALTAAKAKALLREIDGILRKLDTDAAAWIDANIPQMYAHGQATSLVTLGEAATIGAGLEVVFNVGLVNEERVRYIVQDAHDDLLAATQNVSRQIKAQVRDIVAQQTRAAALSTENERSVMKRVTANLHEANIAIIDKAGRRWKLEDYARVVVRTKLGEAHREGAIEKGVAEGFDLARISAHGAKDACRNFEGALVSMTGKTRGYRTVAELRASGLVFHPFCGHSIHPCNPRLLPDSVRQQAEEKAAQVDEALKLAEEGKMNSHGLKKGA